MAQGGLAAAARHDRDVVDVSVVGHGGQCGLSVAGDELVRSVFFPEFDKVVLWHDRDYTWLLSCINYELTFVFT